MTVAPRWTPYPLEATYARASSLGDASALGVTARALAYTAMLRGALGEALEWSQAAWELAEGDPRQRIRAVSLRATVLHARGDLDAAGESFREADTLGDRPAARRALWRARWLLDRGDAPAALTLAQVTHAELRVMRWTGHAAEAACVAGAAALMSGEVGRAVAWCEEAPAVASRTGEVELILRAHTLAADLARSAGDAQREAAHQALVDETGVWDENPSRVAGRGTRGQRESAPPLQLNLVVRDGPEAEP